MLLSGEAGIGKSTLLAEAASEARERGMVVLTGAAYDRSSAPPYGIWRELLELHVASGSVPDLPSWLRADQIASEQDSRGTLFLDAYRLLAAAAESSPILIVMEDVQWADNASLELLRYVARRVMHLRAVLAVSYRDDGQTYHSPFFQLLPDLIRECNPDRIQLERLKFDEIRQLVSGSYSLDPDNEARLAGYLLEHAEGVPLFTTELLRELADSQVIARNDHGWHVGALDQVPVPSVVRQMIEARLRRLGDSTCELLTIAAVAGYEVHDDLWLQITNVTEDDLHSTVEAALSAGILIQRPDGALAFSHALVREALQTRVIIPRRRSIHRNIAEVLIAQPLAEHDPATIAYHLQQGHDQRAGEWLVRAGEHACSVYAFETAIDSLSAALEHKGSRDQFLDIRALRQRGLAYEIMGAFDLALNDHQAALRLARECDNTHLIWQTMLDLGALWSARDYLEAGAYFHEALVLARAIGDEQMIARGLNRIGNWNTNIDRPADGMACHHEALQVFQRNADAQGIADTLDLLAISAYMHGDLPASKEYLRHATRLFREQNNQQALASALPTLMLTHGSYDGDTVKVASGSVEEALSYGEEGLNIAREIGWHAGTAYALIHIGYFQGLQGRYNHALDSIHQGLDLATNIAHREWITAGHTTLGIVLADMQSTGPAQEHLERAHASAQAMNSRYWIRTSSSGLAWVHLMEGNVELAEELLDHVLEQDINVDSLGLRQCWLRRAEVQLARDEPLEALRIVDHMIERAPGGDADHPIPHLEWLRGRALLEMERLDDAEHAFNRARIRAQQLSYRSLLWRIDLDHGRLLGSDGHPDGKPEAFNRGRQQIAEIAATISDTTLSTRFLDRALALFPEGDPDVSTDDQASILSPRETEVLRLVARGMTDAEVSDQLFISPRTVGRHLQSVYNKLGVNSRTAAASAALERQLL